jgi:hypothetical protein
LAEHDDLKLLVLRRPEPQEDQSQDAAGQEVEKRGGCSSGGISAPRDAAPCFSRSSRTNLDHLSVVTPFLLAVVDRSGAGPAGHRPWDAVQSRD